MAMGHRISFGGTGLLTRAAGCMEAMPGTEIIFLRSSWKAPFPALRILTEWPCLGRHVAQSVNDRLGIRHFEDQGCTVPKGVERITEKPDRIVDHEKSVVKRRRFSCQYHRFGVLDAPTLKRRRCGGKSVDELLKLAGTDKSQLLSAQVWIADMRLSEVKRVPPAKSENRPADRDPGPHRGPSQRRF